MPLPRIKVDHVYPAIPDRRCDWLAYYDGEEEKREYGWGHTKADAVLDLIECYPRGLQCVHDLCKVCREDATEVEAKCLRYWCPKHARARHERYIDSVVESRKQLAAKFGADRFPEVPRDQLCKSGWQPRFDTGVPADMQRHPPGCPDPDYCFGGGGCHWNCKHDPDMEDF